MQREGNSQKAVRAGRSLIAGSTVVALFMAHASTFADQIWLDKPTGSPIFASARITRIEKTTVYFLVNGNETSRDLARISRISVDDEPALNQAEEAMALGKFDDAVDAYQRVARSSAKPWVREWAAGRLVEASSKSGRFDAASGAYIALLLKDPAAAAGRKPAMPAKGSTYLDTAVAQVNAALATPRLHDAQSSALLAYLIELHVARQDDSAANAAAAKLDELLARDPANPAAGAANARRKLQAAGKLVDGRQYSQAIAAIEADGAMFTEADQQAEAMFLLASSKLGLASSGDKPKLQDAALAYMRVVAHFKDEPRRPRVAQALAHAAAICEQLGDRPAAVELYTDLALQFADDEAVAASARQALERLKGS